MISLFGMGGSNDADADADESSDFVMIPVRRIVLSPAVYHPITCLISSYRLPCITLSSALYHPTTCLVSPYHLPAAPQPSMTVWCSLFKMA